MAGAGFALTGFGFWQLGQLTSDVGAAARALDLLNATGERQAAVLAYNRVFMLVALLFVMGLPLVVLLRRWQGSTGEHVVAD